MDLLTQSELVVQTVCTEVAMVPKDLPVEEGRKALEFLARFRNQIQENEAIYTALVNAYEDKAFVELDDRVFRFLDEYDLITTDQDGLPW